MFGDHDWPLNASRGLSAIAEFLFTFSLHQTIFKSSNNNVCDPDLHAVIPCTVSATVVGLTGILSERNTVKQGTVALTMNLWQRGKS